MIQPVAAPQAPVSPTTAPATTNNISSEQIERTEVEKIAAELKDQLNESHKKTEHEVSLRPAPGGPAQDDSIFIDQEGTFHLNNDYKKTEEPKN